MSRVLRMSDHYLHICNKEIVNKLTVFSCNFIPKYWLCNRKSVNDLLWWIQWVCLLITNYTMLCNTIKIPSFLHRRKLHFSSETIKLPLATAKALLIVSGLSLMYKRFRLISQTRVSSCSSLPVERFETEKKKHFQTMWDVTGWTL